MRAEGQAVLVAGGTGGLGTAVLDALLDGGFDVTATWLAEQERDRVADLLAGRTGLTLVRADLLDEDCVHRVVHGMKRLDAVVNLVGGYAAGTRVHETSLEQFEDMLRLNLRPNFLLARAAIPRLLAAGGGSFVAVSARAALQPFAGAAGYVTAKAAVLAFVRALDAEYRDRGLRCNAIVPSVIDTPANRAAQPDADFSRWAAPADIARVVRFLVTEDAGVVTGAAIPVYGRA